MNRDDLTIIKFDPIRRLSTFKAYSLIINENGSPKDLTGYQAKAELKRRPGDVLIKDLALNLDDAATGQINMEAYSVDFPAGAYVFDLILVSPSGDKEFFIEGHISVTENITSWP